MKKIVLMLVIVATATSIANAQFKPMEFETYEAVSFSGGQDALIKFISDNLEYPEICRELAVEGDVKAKIYFNKEGEVQEVIISESIHELCTEEVKRVIALMPKWNPARFKGVSIPSKVVINFKFQFSF